MIIKYVIMRKSDGLYLQTDYWKLNPTFTENIDNAKEFYPGTVNHICNKYFGETCEVMKIGYEVKTIEPYIHGNPTNRMMTGF